MEKWFQPSNPPIPPTEFERLLDFSASIVYNAGVAKKRSDKLSDQIRAAIDTCGLTRYRIAQETGINESQLARFYHGQQGLSLESLDRLGELLNLQVTIGRKPATKAKGK